MLICIATGAVLYNGSLAVLVGHRQSSPRSTCAADSLCRCPWPPASFTELSRGPPPVEPLQLRRLALAPVLNGARRHELGRQVQRWSEAQRRVQCGRDPGYAGHRNPHVVHQKLTRLSSRSGATFVHDWLSLAIGLS